MNSRFHAAWAVSLIAMLVPPLCAEHFNIGVHDPVMIQQDGAYYVFGTGRGIAVFSSKDMKNWQSAKPVFAETPAWVARQFPKARDFWAPDIAEHNGTYYLYYAVSGFGSNNSAIGVATNRTLNPDSPDFRWVDHGMVLESVTGRDMFNAIDPNLAFDQQGVPWLSFGSFWSGIKIVKLNANLTEVALPEEWHTIAARDRLWKLEENDAGDELSGAIEAPFIFSRNGMYYLFVSWDRCCRGVNSTYKVVVGRSEKITGPYLSKEGAPMQMGGGSLVVGGNKNWPGVGHNSAYTFNGKDFLVFHGYDVSDNGRSKLWIQEMKWDANGWPNVELQ
ncbi:MAG: arabinan endo-1,5-alpha-L-arabinosidase [Candidatus Solibacter sp.]